MVVIRLARAGAKSRPFFHVVVTNSRNPRDGRYIERLGYYNPIATGEAIKLQLNMDRVNLWLAKGAQPSDKAKYLIDNFAEIAIESEKLADQSAQAKAEQKQKAAQKAAKPSSKEKPATEAKPKAEPKEKAEPKAAEEKPEQKEEPKTAKAEAETSSEVETTPEQEPKAEAEQKQE